VSKQIAVGQGGINPAGLTVEEAARLLSLPVEKVREHVARGLPVAVDGRLNLVQYVAWLNKEMSRAD
jgi:hypothetical protein